MSSFSRLYKATIIEVKQRVIFIEDTSAHNLRSCEQMHCPFCNTEDTKVIDSRLGGEGSQVRRRRECLQCQERFTTYEAAELNFPRIIKRDGRRSIFDENKLRKGLLKALEKRPITSEQIELAIHRIKKRLRALGEQEIDSQFIGELVMNELQALDKVGYVRFASVYRRFQDVNAFNEEIQRLQHQQSQKIQDEDEISTTTTS